MPSSARANDLLGASCWGALHHLCALDRLDLLGQRRRVGGGAQGHCLDELLGAGAPGGAREGVAVDVQDAGQRGGARVTSLTAERSRPIRTT